MPFAKVDLQWGWPTQQLRFASLAHVEVLLDAYQATGDIAFLEGARDIVDAWAAFERSRVLPIGFLWNDHAIAQRVLVLTRYWSLLRGSPAFKPESARALLGFVQRSGLMLAKPGHFTVRTNHGVMQNLALLHVAAAFPALPEAPEFRRVAVARLKLQFAFYQSAEGVVLEHSPGYHGLGTNLLAALASYQRVLGEDLELQVTERLARACRVLRVVRPAGPHAADDRQYGRRPRRLAGMRVGTGPGRQRARVRRTTSRSFRSLGTWSGPDSKRWSCTGATLPLGRTSTTTRWVS